ncbi:MAG: phasin [Methyloligellaceae bacterium]
MADTKSQIASEGAKPKAAQAAAEKSAAPMADAPKTVDAAVPEVVRSFAEKTVGQSRDAYERTKDVLEDTVEVLEKTLDEAGQGAVALNRKVIDITQSNLNSGLDLAKQLASAKTPAEVMELQASYVRKQFETLATQAEEIRVLSTQVATDTVEPFKAHVSRSMAGFKLAG